MDICARCSGDHGGLANSYLISAFVVDVDTEAHSDFYFSVLNDSLFTQSDAPNILQVAWHNADPWNRCWM